MRFAPITEIMRVFSLFLLSVFFFVACERSFVPAVVNEPLDLVVEGYIEAGEEAGIPYVFLTKSRSYFGEIDSTAFSDLYVHDAVVNVTHKEIDYPFSEVCLQSLTPEQKVIVSTFLGFDPDSIKTDICVYLDLSFQLKGEDGGQYDLTIESEGKTHTATTTIPRMVKIDSLYFKELPEADLEEYKELHAYLTDPGDDTDFWRYFTAINGGQYETSNFSIYDDGFISGQTVEFILNNGSRVKEHDPTSFGLYKVGDTLTLKWTSIDEAHYDFRKTAEFSKAQGPFSSYVRIKGNVSDALGIWGGYHVQILETIIE